MSYRFLGNMKSVYNIQPQKTAVFDIESGYKDANIQIHSSSIIRAFTEEPGKIFLLYGEAGIFQLSLQMASFAMANGNSIAVVDGCNRFDAHALSRFARARKIDPDKFLERIFVSRGFTCYQIEQAITRKLPSFLGKIKSNTALIFGVLDTLYDEQASLHEAQQILQRILNAFKKMKSKGVSLLLACSERKVEPPERNQLFVTLKSNVDRVYKFDIDNNGALRLYLEPHRLEQNITKGALSNGTNSANLYQSDRRRANKLVKVPARTAQRRSGCVR